MIKAAAMLMRHIGYVDQAKKVEMALDITTQFEKKLQITGRNNGATNEDFTNYLFEWINNPSLKEEWEKFSNSVSEEEVVSA